MGVGVGGTLSFLVGDLLWLLVKYKQVDAVAVAFVDTACARVVLGIKSEISFVCLWQTQ